MLNLFTPPDRSGSGSLAKKRRLNIPNHFGQRVKNGYEKNRATKDVIWVLIRSKCLPVLLYGLEACPLRKFDISSLDFVVNRSFKTNNIDIVN